MITTYKNLDDSIANLGKNKKPGSSVVGGVPYQNIFSLDIPSARSSTEKRADRIMELVNVRGKSVLDLGCNVGTMSYRFSQNGAIVTGVDYDDASLDVANIVYPHVKFVNQDINIEFIKSLPYYDVIVWVSQFMWMVKQYGIDYALDCLWEIGRHCNTLVF